MRMSWLVKVLCSDVVQVVILENLSGLAHLGIQVRFYLVCCFVVASVVKET